jgi:hypothetical protein
MGSSYSTLKLYTTDHELVNNKKALGREPSSALAAYLPVLSDQVIVIGQRRRVSVLTANSIYIYIYQNPKYRSYFGREGRGTERDGSHFLKYTNEREYRLELLGAPCGGRGDAPRTQEPISTVITRVHNLVGLSNNNLHVCYYLYLYRYLIPCRNLLVFQLLIVTGFRYIHTSSYQESG